MARKTGIVGLGFSIVLGSRFRLSFGFDVKPSSTIDAVIMSDLSIYRYIEYMTTIKLVTLRSLEILSVDVDEWPQPPTLAMGIKSLPAFSFPLSHGSDIKCSS